MRTRPQLVRSIWQLHKPIAQGQRAATSLITVARQAADVISRLHAANTAALAANRGGLGGKVHASQADSIQYLREASDFITDNAGQLDTVLRDAHTQSQAIVSELFTDVERLHVGHKAAPPTSYQTGAASQMRALMPPVPPGAGHF